jgi:putative transposase
LARKHGWGGKRAGAGRKRKDGCVRPPGVPHVRRPGLDARHPVGITLKVRREVWSLRGPRTVRALRRALEAGHDRPAFRVVHFSIQSNHLHLIVEAASRAGLSAGVQGLEVRMARALNGAMSRRGPVFADRFHAHALRTPTEVARARRYVLDNFAIHRARAGERPAPDLLTSETLTTCAAAPRTWLLRIGWRRGALRGPRPAGSFRDAAEETTGVAAIPRRG